MWEINNSFQAVSFLYSVIFGVIYCLLYDIFRALRKLYSPSAVTVFLQDIFYFVIIAFFTFLFLMAVSNGEIRAYVIVGMAFGFAACFFTLSRLWVKAVYFLFKLLNSINGKIIDILNRFLSFAYKKTVNCVKCCENLLIKLKKIFKKHLKREQ